MSLRTWNLPHPYIICNLRSPLREVKIARLSGRSVLCTVEGQNGEGRTWGEPESWATECPSCGFSRHTFSPVSFDDTGNTSQEVVSGFPWGKQGSMAMCRQTWCWRSQEFYNFIKNTKLLKLYLCTDKTGNNVTPEASPTLLVFY
ncbi:uncharacterized protein LOC116095384 [Mastomys coucha]|uniref:uncharacterized protein LOC116095384 n=1 Tax=Mastomys coucha TaxID=35658 RepID=UPI001261E669|nr:uncharacterized protein LOC116095384 [Mastomys coucha]